jgi:hypothetical protein
MNTRVKPRLSWPCRGFPIPSEYRIPLVIQKGFTTGKMKSIINANSVRPVRIRLANWIKILSKSSWEIQSPFHRGEHAYIQCRHSAEHVYERINPPEIGFGIVSVISNSYQFGSIFQVSSLPNTIQRVVLRGYYLI